MMPEGLAKGDAKPVTQSLATAYHSVLYTALFHVIGSTVLTSVSHKWTSWGTHQTATFQ